MSTRKSRLSSGAAPPVGGEQEHTCECGHQRSPTKACGLKKNVLKVCGCCQQYVCSSCRKQCRTCLQIACATCRNSLLKKCHLCIEKDKLLAKSLDQLATLPSTQVLESLKRLHRDTARLQQIMDPEQLVAELLDVCQLPDRRRQYQDYVKAKQKPPPKLVEEKAAAIADSGVAKEEEVVQQKSTGSDVLAQEVRNDDVTLTPTRDVDAMVSVEAVVRTEERAIVSEEDRVEDKEFVFKMEAAQRPHSHRESDEVFEEDSVSRDENAVKEKDEQEMNEPRNDDYSECFETEEQQLSWDPMVHGEADTTATGACLGTDNILVTSGQQMEQPPEVVAYEVSPRSDESSSESSYSSATEDVRLRPPSVLEVSEDRDETEKESEVETVSSPKDQDELNNVTVDINQVDVADFPEAQPPEQEPELPLSPSHDTTIPSPTFPPPMDHHSSDTDESDSDSSKSNDEASDSERVARLTEIDAKLVEAAILGGRQSAAIFTPEDVELMDDEQFAHFLELMSEDDDEQREREDGDVDGRTRQDAVRMLLDLQMTFPLELDQQVDSSLDILAACDTTGAVLTNGSVLTANDPHTGNNPTEEVPVAMVDVIEEVVGAVWHQELAQRISNEEARSEADGRSTSSNTNDAEVDIHRPEVEESERREQTYDDSDSDSKEGEDVASGHSDGGEDTFTSGDKDGETQDDIDNGQRIEQIIEVHRLSMSTDYHTSVLEGFRSASEFGRETLTSSQEDGATSITLDHVSAASEERTHSSLPVESGPYNLFTMSPSNKRWSTNRKQVPGNLADQKPYKTYIPVYRHRSITLADRYGTHKLDEQKSAPQEPTSLPLLLTTTTTSNSSATKIKRSSIPLRVTKPQEPKVDVTNEKESKERPSNGTPNFPDPDDDLDDSVFENSTEDNREDVLPEVDSQQ